MNVLGIGITNLDDNVGSEVPNGRGFASWKILDEILDGPSDPREVSVLENVAAAIDPGCFSVPHAEDPVVFGAREQAGHLASPLKHHHCVNVKKISPYYLKNC